MFETISVQTSSTDAYSISIGTNLLEEAGRFVRDNFSADKVILIIDQNVHQHHIFRIEEVFQHFFSRILKYVVPSGEHSKSMDQYSNLVDSILTEGVERSTPIVAIGGGVVGDLAGFVAASILRGVPLIHIPTTLLAMVDSSIGGKTGINHSTGKNLIGAFYQPKAVFADVSFLNTLPRKEWVNGLSEIIKYGMIESPKLLEQLIELVVEDNFQHPEKWISVIQQSAAIKVDVVQRDVKEGGVRAFLNFGHTYAHVIERIGNYEDFSHGEAVFAGMFGAVKASNLFGAKVSLSTLEVFKPFYSIDLEKLEPHFNELPSLMLRDKKAKNATIRLVLLQHLGQPMVREVEDVNLINESWRFLLNQFN